MDKNTKLELISLLLSVECKDSKENVPFKVGEKYFIRTVTNYIVGKLEEITPEFFVFSSASWVADTGRFSNFLEKGEANEVEPVKGLYRIGRGSIVDGFDWNHKLPLEQK